VLGRMPRSLMTQLRQCKTELLHCRLALLSSQCRSLLRRIVMFLGGLRFANPPYELRPAPAAAFVSASSSSSRLTIMAQPATFARAARGASPRAR
jgi:hypothetical protein